MMSEVSGKFKVDLQKGLGNDLRRLDGIHVPDNPLPKAGICSEHCEHQQRSDMGYGTWSFANIFQRRLRRSDR